MAGTIVNLVIVLMILGIWYALISEGLWGAALMFFNVMFAGLIAFNFYEPLAKLLAEQADFMAGFADSLCLLVLFGVTLVILRLTTDSIAPAMVRFPTPVYHLGRVLFAAGGSLITMAIVILAFEASPVDKKMFGVVDYKFQPPFKQGLDRAWLAFMQYTTGNVFADHHIDEEEAASGVFTDPLREYRNTRVFDARGSWLIDHQNARPHGSGSVPPAESAE